MPAIPFVGQAYTLSSLNYDCQRSINVYPIRSESGTSKAISALVGTPGRHQFCRLPEENIRGAIEVNGRVFWVAANKLYEIYIDGTFMIQGTLMSTFGVVSIDTNGRQICIVDNPNGYIFELTSNTLTQITDPYFTGAVTVTYCNGYFVFNRPDSDVYYWCALYDGLTGDPLDFASAEGLPDNIVAVKTVHQQVWLFGTRTTQVVYNPVVSDAAFETVQGALMMYGCAAPYSVVTSANVVFWLGQDGDGNGTVFMASGYQPQRISTYAIERILQTVGNVNDATGFSYQEQGHFFYVLNLPGAKTSLVYDVTEQQWHERAYFEMESIPVTVQKATYLHLANIWWVTMRAGLYPNRTWSSTTTTAIPFGVYALPLTFRVI